MDDRTMAAGNRPMSVAAGEAAAEGASPEHLRGHMGTLAVVFTVMAGVAPLTGAAGYLPLVIGYGNGLGAPLTFVIIAVVFGLFAVGYLAMVRCVPRPGAFYAYVTAGLGKKVGLGTAAAMVCFYLSAASSIYIFGGLQLQSLLSSKLGVNPPWWACSLILIAVVAIFAYRGIDFNAKVLGTVVAIEFAVLLVFNATTLLRGGSAGPSAEPFTWAAFSSGSVAVAVIFALAIMTGFETAAIYREEVRNPSVMIPRATYLIIGLIALSAMVTTYCIIVALGTDGAAAIAAADPATAFTTASDAMVGAVFSGVVSVLLVTSTLACALATVNVTTRYIFNLGTDRVLPRMLGGVHRRHGSPHRASMVPSIFIAGVVTAVVVSGLDPVQAYGTLGGVTSYIFEAILILVSISVIVYFRRHRDSGEPAWKVVIAPALSVGVIGVLLFTAVLHAETLLGKPSLLTYGLVGVVLAMCALGAGYAAWAARNKPDVYVRIGRSLD